MRNEDEGPRKVQMDLVGTVLPVLEPSVTALFQCPECKTVKFESFGSHKEMNETDVWCPNCE